MISKYYQRVWNFRLVPFPSVKNLKLLLYNSKLQSQTCDWTKDSYFLVCKDLSLSFSTWLTLLILEVSLHSLLLWPTVWHPRIFRPSDGPHGIYFKAKSRKLQTNYALLNVLLDIVESLSKIATKFSVTPIFPIWNSNIILMPHF